MNALLLDTHIALWLDSGSDRLRQSTRDLIDKCWRDGGTIFLSAVTAWEIALLVDGGRIDIDISVESWIRRFLDRPGIKEAQLTLHSATQAYALNHLEHRDPVDRLLIATAIDLACPLITYDDRILRFGDKHGRQYRFTTSV
jgi:PIN domain nuclease of toxin-antitoxin system